MNPNEYGRGWTQPIAFIAVVALIGAGMYMFLRDGGGAGRPVALGAQVAAAGEAVAEPIDLAPTTTAAPAAPAATAAPTEAPAEASVAATPSTESTPAQPATDTSAPTTTVAPPQIEVTKAGATPDTTDTTTTEAATETAGGAATDGFGYPAAPDGTPLPIIATYDVGTVTLTGHAPSEAARQRLVALAAANSQDGATVIDRLVVNELVPANVGVRVIETNSPRFAEGDARITADHASQLDRVVAIMKGLPHVSVLVIGHADQRGDDAANFALSNDRARAVVDYLVFLGVEPTRVASQAAGESHLLTLEDDAAALALNRRTEFIFYGVLVG